jgi:NTP pyrophosphatase (non-canonical NTP hydrolase)
MIKDKIRKKKFKTRKKKLGKPMTNLLNLIKYLKLETRKTLKSVQEALFTSQF